MGGRENAALLTMVEGPRRRLRSHLGSDGSGGAVQSACNGVQRQRVDACRSLGRRRRRLGPCNGRAEETPGVGSSLWTRGEGAGGLKVKG